MQERINKMLACLYFLLTFFFLTISNLYAIQVTGISGKVSVNVDEAKIKSMYPSISSTTINNFKIYINTLLNDPNYSNSIQSAFNNLTKAVEDELAKYGTQKKLARGFANANSYAVQAGSHHSYANYDLFAITTGVLFGVQAPSIDSKYYENFSDKIVDEGDLYSGLAGAISYVNIGLNGKIFGIDKFYFSLRYGGANSLIDDQIEDVSDDLGDIELNADSFGIGVNYNLLEPRNLGMNIIKWRGFSIGTGFFYNKFNISFTPKLDKQIEKIYYSDIYVDQSTNQSIGYSLNSVLEVDPSAKLNIKTSTYTIPIELITSVQLLWLLNFSVGAGIDMVFGKADIKVTADTLSSVSAKENNNLLYVTTISPYTISADGSTLGEKPTFFHPKLMLGFGLNLGPAKIDIPVTYYFDTGASVGITVGIVW
ncbi:MAG: hypothetical protein HQK76_21000 [Desulfobacterales bacterium]|nr:hypothetical protein [Desulfobacterales bacterium]